MSDGSAVRLCPKCSAPLALELSAASARARRLVRTSCPQCASIVIVRLEESAAVASSPPPVIASAPVAPLARAPLGTASTDDVLDDEARPAAARVVIGMTIAIVVIAIIYWLTRGS